MKNQVMKVYVIFLSLFGNKSRKKTFHMYNSTYEISNNNIELNNKLREVFNLFNHGFSLL